MRLYDSVRARGLAQPARVRIDFSTMGDVMANPDQYQQYSQFQMPPTPQRAGIARPAIPATVQRAVAAMFVGAVCEVVTGVVAVVTVGGTSTAALGGAGIFGGLVGAGLWIWMAVANRGGNHWARVTGTVFFGIASFGLVIDVLIYAIINHLNNMNNGLTTPVDPVLSLVLSAVDWLIGLYATIMIWQKQSGPFYKTQPAYGVSGWGVPGAPGVAPYGYPSPYQQPYPYPQANPYQQGNPYPQVPGQMPAPADAPFPAPPLDPANPWDVPQG